MTPLEELVAAWEAWDRAPTDRGKAHRKEDAILAAGLHGRGLHDQVADLRRSGLSVRQALKRLT